MKNFVRILSVTLVVAMLAVTLVSCGGPSGTYTAGDTGLTSTYTQYEFKGSKFVFTSYVMGKKIDATSYEGKFKVKDGEITFTWENADGEEKSDTLTYKENEDGSIEIGAFTYKKDK